MILIDVYVPALDKVYDFSVDENSAISVLTEELAEMICQYEQYDPIEHPERIMLACESKRLRLPANETLLSCGIRHGERLIMT